MYEVAVTFVHDSDIYNVNCVIVNIHIKLTKVYNHQILVKNKLPHAENMQVCGLLGAIFLFNTLKQR